jgi:outer membrane protein TolC
MIRNPEIRAIQARVQRMTTMIELAEQTAYPPNSAGLSTMAPLSHATLGSGKAQEPFTTRPKSTPDPWFGMKDAYLREARDGVHAAEARLQAIRNETYFAIESDRVEVQTARRLLALYRDVQLEQAEQAYRDALAGYAADRIEFLNVIDTVRRWLQFQLAADQALRDVHIGHARLEGTVGTAIP